MGANAGLACDPTVKLARTNPDYKIRPATPTGGVSLYLNLMPAGDVRPCVEMMRYLMGVGESAPSSDGFREHFRTAYSNWQNGWRRWPCCSSLFMWMRATAF